MIAGSASGLAGHVPTAFTGSVAPAPTRTGLPGQNICNISIQKPLTGAQRKLLFALQENIAYLAKKYGINSLIFGTITFSKKIYDIKKAQQHFNSFANWVRQRFRNGIIGVHRDKDGSIHYHFVAVAQVDVRTSYDFNAVKNGDYSSVCLWLRDEWAAWRKVTNNNGKRDGKHRNGRGCRITAAAYPHIGRCELQPIRTTVEQVASYLAGDIAKGLQARSMADKGARIIRYWGDSRCAWQNFSWVGPRSWQYRAKLRQWALVEEGCASVEALREKHGPRWCHDNRDKIEAQLLTVYPTAKHARLDNHEILLELADCAGPIFMMPVGCELVRARCREDIGNDTQPVALCVAVKDGAIQTRREFTPNRPTSTLTACQGRSSPGYRPLHDAEEFMCGFIPPHEMAAFGIGRSFYAHEAASACGDASFI